MSTFIDMSDQLRRLSLKTWKDLAAAGEDPGAVLIPKACDCEVEKAAGPGMDRALKFTISTSVVDRENDTIRLSGWDLRNFRKSGVILWAHMGHMPPIGDPLKTWREEQRLKSIGQFTPEDMPHPLGMGFGHTIYRMYRERYLKSVSVGYRPTKWEQDQKRTEEHNRYAVNFLDQELLEYSPVPIPANPEALVEAGRKGIDVRPIYDWCEHTLDTGEVICLPREVVEQAHKDLKSFCGSKIKGQRIEIDMGEAHSFLDSFKRFLGFGTDKQPETNPPEPEEPTAEEKIAALEAEIEELKKSAEPEPEPEPGPETSKEASIEAMKEFVSSPEGIAAIRSAIREMIEPTVSNAIRRHLTGEID